MANLTKSALWAIVCQFSSSIAIDTTWVNIGDFGVYGEIGKIGNFGKRLPILSN